MQRRRVLGEAEHQPRAHAGGAAEGARRQPWDEIARHLHAKRVKPPRCVPRARLRTRAHAPRARRGVSGALGMVARARREVRGAARAALGAGRAASSKAATTCTCTCTCTKCTLHRHRRMHRRMHVHRAGSSACLVLEGGVEHLRRAEAEHREPGGQAARGGAHREQVERATHRDGAAERVARDHHAPGGLLPGEPLDGHLHMHVHMHTACACACCRHICCRHML